jgi:hypothetical protein
MQKSPLRAFRFEAFPEILRPKEALQDDSISFINASERIDHSFTESCMPPIPCCREFSSVFFWSPTRISAESAHNREILPGPQGMEQGITGICYLTAYLSRTYSRFSAFSPASCRELTANPGFAVTPKNETGENIPIYREWRVDEEISALDDGTEAPGSGADGSGQA